MTANVTSIAKMRAAARDKAARQRINNRTATTLLVLVVVLVVIGLGATQSASSVVAIDQTEDSLFYFKRQLVGVGLGTLALLVTSRIPYRHYRKLAIPLFLLTVSLLIAVLVAGTEVNGARRWLPLPFLSFQPSEIAKVAVVFVLAYLLEKKHKLLGRFGHFIVPVLATVGVVGALVMKQPDLGTLIIIGAATIAVIMASDAPMKWVFVLGLVAVVAVTVLAFSESYRASRITAFLDPYADSSGDGYQLIQGYYALGNGGIFGVGLGASRARWFYLPNAHTDFIFAIIGEEGGFVVAVLVLGIYALIVARALKLAVAIADPFRGLVAAGIALMIAVQVFLNVAVVTGIAPTTGLPLPFLSYGGSSLVVHLAAVGVLLRVSMDTPREGAS